MPQLGSPEQVGERVAGLAEGTSRGQQHVLARMDGHPHALPLPSTTHAGQHARAASGVETACG